MIIVHHILSKYMKKRSSTPTLESEQCLTADITQKPAKYDTTPARLVNFFTAKNMTGMGEAMKNDISETESGSSSAGRDHSYKREI